MAAGRTKEFGRALSCRDSTRPSWRPPTARPRAWTAGGEPASAPDPRFRCELSLGDCWLRQPDGLREHRRLLALRPRLAAGVRYRPTNVRPCNFRWCDQL